MATIRDVAQLAGVSVATVSNALNNPARVSPELLTRVRAAVDKLGYAPDAAARSLRKRSSGLLGLIVADITNPFFSELFEAIELAAAARGFSVILCNSNEITEREETHLRMLRSQRIDGLILAPTGTASMNRAALLAALEMPVVLVDRAMEGLGYDAVVLNNHRAAYEATSYAIGCGHRRIALINGPNTVRTAADRLQGYRESLLAAGLALDPALVESKASVDPCRYFKRVAMRRLGLEQGIAAEGSRAHPTVGSRNSSSTKGGGATGGGSGARAHRPRSP